MLVSIVLCMMQIKIREMQFCVLLKGKKLESSLRKISSEEDICGILCPQRTNSEIKGSK